MSFLYMAHCHCASTVGVGDKHAPSGRWGSDTLLVSGALPSRGMERSIVPPSKLLVRVARAEPVGRRITRGGASRLAAIFESLVVGAAPPAIAAIRARVVLGSALLGALASVPSLSRDFQELLFGCGPFALLNATTTGRAHGVAAHPTGALHPRHGHSSLQRGTHEECGEGHYIASPGHRRSALRSPGRRGTSGESRRGEGP
mmetsp:Transcript_30137/g.64138  ORF Transcript_30137/g.64138 Transcript_30137/m.64138 type:complete len:202 (+) Transcript_30137:2-607(+)